MLRAGLAIAAGVAVADQLIKWWAVAALAGASEPVVVTPFLKFVMVWNRGVSFGLFGGGTVPPWLFAALAGAIVVALAAWLRRVDERWTGIGIALVIGGAVGNIVDRLRFGAVADFVVLHAGRYEWPAFNLADSAITVGVAALIIDALLPRRERHN